MKKTIILTTTAVLFILMAISNIKESEFINIINESSDPLSEFYMQRFHKKAKPIIRGKDYFYGVFNIDYYNCVFFSIAKIEYGWGGTLNVLGRKLEKGVENVEINTYFLIFGSYYKF